MTTLMDSPQDSEPPSTPKRNNSDITYEKSDFKDTFVSPDASDNKRNKCRFGDDPMEEEDKLNKNKKQVKTKVTQRLLNLTARAAAQKKDGAAKPGATPRGMAQFLTPRDTLGATTKYKQKSASKTPVPSKFQANFKQFLVLNILVPPGTKPAAGIRDGVEKTFLAIKEATPKAIALMPKRRPSLPITNKALLPKKHAEFRNYGELQVSAVKYADSSG